MNISSKYILYLFVITLIGFIIIAIFCVCRKKHIKDVNKSTKNVGEVSQKNVGRVTQEKNSTENGGEISQRKSAITHVDNPTYVDIDWTESKCN